jgi:cytochrome c-type biogenesis protein CcmH/NrfF
VRTTPPKSGFGLVAWLIPALAVLVGLAVLVVMTRRWVRRRRAAGDEEPAALDPADGARLDRELERFDDA